MLTAITGAGGFLGINLIQALLAEGRQIRALAYHPQERERLASYPIEVVSADISDLDSLRAAFKGAEVVYHLAGYITLKTADAMAEKINVEGVRNVIAACQAQGVRRLLHVSSFHVHQPSAAPLREDSPLVPDDYPLAYPRSKAKGERLVQAAELETVIIRPSALLGPNDHQPSYFGRTLVQIAQGRLPILVQGACDWVDVRDVARGAILAETKAPSGSAYLIGGNFSPLRDLAEEVARQSGARRPVAYLPMPLAKSFVPLVGAWAKLTGTNTRLSRTALDALQSNSHISLERARAELGYAPRPFSQTIAETLAWFKAQGRW